MIQEIIILVLFVVAAAYVGQLIFRSFQTKEGGCAKGCGACSTIDFKKIQKELDQQQVAK